MPKFTVEAQSSQAPDQTFSKVMEFLNTDPDLRKLDSKLQCEFNEANLSGRASGSQFSADLQVSPVLDGSKVAITVDLPFALALFKGKIQQVLQKKLESTLA